MTSHEYWEGYADCEEMNEKLLEIAKAAIRFYDNLDVDHLLPEYFGSGSEGYQYRGLRDAIRAYRAREPK